MASCNFRGALKKHRIIDLDSAVWNDNKARVAVQRIRAIKKIKACKSFISFYDAAWSDAGYGRCKRMHAALKNAAYHQGACMASYRAYQRKRTR